MDVVKTLKHGQNGTSRHIELYGDNLDAERQIRYTAAEITIERCATPMTDLGGADYRWHKNQRTHIRPHETELKRLIRKASSICNRKHKLADSLQTRDQARTGNKNNPATVVIYKRDIYLHVFSCGNQGQQRQDTGRLPTKGWTQ